MARRICILDDDPAFLQDLRAAMAGGYEVAAFASSAEFREAFSPRRFDLIVLDMRLEGAKEGLDVLREIHGADPYQPVVVATAYADTETYLETLQAGALLYVDKTRHTAAAMALLFDAVIQQGRLRREQAAVTRAMERMDPLEMVGTTQAVRSLRRRIDEIAAMSPQIAVVAGEPGSGRELAARNLHARAFKGIAPPLAVLPQQSVPAADTLRLLTGQRTAAGASRGILEEAHGTGMVVRCSDDLPSSILEFLIGAQKAGKFQPDGDKRVHPLVTTLYLVCEDAEATLSVVAHAKPEVIHVPPLRDRKEDIPLLVSYLLEAHRQRGVEGAGAVEPAAMVSLLAHHWPGNVAELRIVLEYEALRTLADGSELIGQDHLSLGVTAATAKLRRWDIDYQEARTQVSLVESAMNELGTRNKTSLSEFLYIQTPTTLTRRIERALERYPDLGAEFPKTGEVFGRTGAMKS